MPQEQSKKNVEVTFTVPAEIHRLMQLVAKARGMTIQEVVVDDVILGIDSALQGCEPECPGLWTKAGYDWKSEYDKELRALLAGGAA